MIDFTLHVRTYFCVTIKNHDEFRIICRAFVRRHIGAWQARRRFPFVTQMLPQPYNHINFHLFPDRERGRKAINEDKLSLSQCKIGLTLNFHEKSYHLFVNRQTNKQLTISSIKKRRNSEK